VITSNSQRYSTGPYLVVELTMSARATRRSGVLTLDSEVPVISTLGGFRVGPNASITTKHQDIKTITSRRVREIHPARGAVLFDTWFWSSTENTEPRLKIQMMAPSWWSPSILLGAINLSAKQNRRLVIYEESSFVELSGCNECFISINNIAFSLFSLDQKELMDELINNYSLGPVDGGTTISPVKSKEK
jgi:hypothetical protein